MHKPICPVCGRAIAGGVEVGGILLHPDCADDVREEADARRERGERVNVRHIAYMLYRQQYAGGDYLIRELPLAIEKRIKHEAIDDNCSIRDIIIKALVLYYEDGVHVY